MRPRRFIAAAALLALGGLARAGDTEPVLVLVSYRVDEQSPSQVDEAVTTRLELPLHELPRLIRMNSTTGHGTVEVELQFDHDATEEDVLAVARRLDEIVLGNVTVLSRSVRLGKPSLNVQLR